MSSDDFTQLLLAGEAVIVRARATFHRSSALRKDYFVRRKDYLVRLEVFSEWPYTDAIRSEGETIINSMYEAVDSNWSFIRPNNVVR